MTRLTFVSLCSHNRLTGNFPSFDTGFFARQVIGLSHNLLDGQLPSINPANLPSIDFSLIRIQTIDISYNFLTGTVNPVIAFIPTMRHIDISGNMFSGSFEDRPGAFYC